MNDAENRRGKSEKGKEIDGERERNKDIYIYMRGKYREILDKRIKSNRNR